MRSMSHDIPRMLRSVVAAIVLAGSLVGNAHAQSDDDFVAAKAAFDRSDWRRLDALAPSLAGHLLERYVVYWQIKSRIDEAPPDTYQSFVARFPDGPLAERLRVDWLKALGRRADWNRFALDYASAAGEDVELACYAIQYRYRRDGAQALAAARPFWFTGQSTPDACEPLFAALAARGELTPADRRERFRLAAAAGNARLAQLLAVDMPAAERIAARDLTAVERDPMHALAKGRFAWKTAAGRELALYALERAARKDAAEARDAWVKWRTHFTQADRNYGNLRVAYHASRQLHPLANQWFADVAGVPLSQEQQAWRVRAALRATAWNDVRSAIDAMPAADQQDAAWRYWRARALSMAGAVDEANALYAGLAGDTSYYGVLAAEALGRGAPVGVTAAAAQVIGDAALAAFARRPDVMRAVKLARLDARLESVREWNHAIRGLDDDALLLAAEYARRIGLFDRAINTAERTASRHDLSLRYLMPFKPQFANAAREQGIDEELLYGIARQESRFVADIVSSAGAVGLMQLMPGTARWVAKQLSATGYSADRITDVDVNTQFGAFYFKYWHERLGRLPALAAAAYNAGPARAQAWRPVGRSIEGAIWVETIPFNETRDYVKRVLSNTIVYASALGRPYVGLTQRLGVVTPRDTPYVTATADP
jgi:soluble lytic murein transglycosylase